MHIHFLQSGIFFKFKMSNRGGNSFLDKGFLKQKKKKTLKIFFI